MRRKAQGAIEYLFMVAAALIIVAIVIRYLRHSAEQTGKTIQNAEQQINNKLNEELNSALSG